MVQMIAYFSGAYFVTAWLCEVHDSVLVTCDELHFQKVEEMQISDMLKNKDIMENVEAFQVRFWQLSVLVFIVIIISWNNYASISKKMHKLFEVTGLNSSDQLKMTW